MPLISIFSRYNKAVNNINNPIELFNQITTTFLNLNSSRLPFLSEDILNIFKIEKNSPEHFSDSLLILDPNTNTLNSGFNKIAIESVILEPESLLSSINSDFKPLFVNLKTISDNIFGDLVRFRDLKRLNSSFRVEDFFLFEIDKFSRYTINNDDKSVLNNMSAIGNMLGRFVIHHVFRDNLKQIDIQNNFIRTTIDTRFSSYIDSNKNNLATILSSFIFSNVLLLTNISPTLKSNTDSVIATSLLNLKSIFSQALNNIALSFYGQVILNNIIKFLTNYLTSTSIDFVIPNDDTLKSMENGFYDSLRQKITDTNLSRLEDLEKISYQFKNSPLFFINSHYLLYNDFINFLINDNDIINDISLVKLNNIADWKSFITIPNPPSFNLINSLDTSKAVEYSVVKHFLEIIVKFIDLKEFEDYLTDTFFLVLENEIKKFFPGVKQKLFDNIDQFKIVFKFILIQDLINGVLWSQFLTDFRNEFVSITLNPITSSDVSKSLVDFQLQEENISLQRLLNNFFISSTMSLILDIVLDNYRIIQKFSI